MKEPGKFDLVYHNKNGAEVVEYAVTQEKRVGVLLFWDCLVIHSLDWLLVVWRVTRCGFLHCLHKVREDPGLGAGRGVVSRSLHCVSLQSLLPPKSYRDSDVEQCRYF